MSSPAPAPLPPELMGNDLSLSSILVKVTRTEGHVLNLKEDMGELTHWLKGNGKIGVIQAQDLRISAMEQSLKERKIKEKFLKTLLHFAGIGIAWLWGVIMGAGSWMPKIMSIFHSLGW